MERIKSLRARGWWQPCPLAFVHPTNVPSSYSADMRKADQPEKSTRGDKRSHHKSYGQNDGRLLIMLIFVHTTPPVVSRMLFCARGSYRPGALLSDVDHPTLQCAFISGLPFVLAEARHTLRKDRLHGQSVLPKKQLYRNRLTTAEGIFALHQDRREFCAWEHLLPAQNIPPPGWFLASAATRLPSRARPVGTFSTSKCNFSKQEDFTWMIVITAKCPGMRPTT